MRYIPLSNSVYKRNRRNFMDEMKGNSLAVFNSNDIYPVSADSELPFEQHRDIFHLTGIDQEETLLLLYPPSKDYKTIEECARICNIYPKCNTFTYGTFTI